MSPREIFTQELDVLLTQMERMACKVKLTYKELKTAIHVCDKERLKSIAQNEENFYAMKKEIEAQCLKLITKQQPIATDLRIVSSILKIVTDIERVGDHAGDIAELILRNDIKKLSEYSVHLDGMIDAAMELFSEAVESYINCDVNAAYRTMEEDDVVDGLFNKVKADIITGLKERPDYADEYIDMMMLAKYLEKIGDHGVNIAKWMVFRESGKWFKYV